jgi:hypothetical protein
MKAHIHIANNGARAAAGAGQQRALVGAPGICNARCAMRAVEDFYGAKAPVLRGLKTPLMGH